MKVILFVFSCLFTNLIANASFQEESELYVGKKSFFYSPFSSPFYSNVLCDSKNSVSFFAPGVVSVFGHFEYNRKIFNNVNLGFGLCGYGISMSLNSKFVNFSNKDLHFTAKIAGVSAQLLKFYELRINQDLKSKKSNRIGISLGYTFFTGQIHSDPFVTKTFPATRVMSLNLEGSRKMINSIDFIYSLGYSYNQLRYNLRLSTGQKSYVNYPEGGQKGHKVFWQDKYGWNASIGLLFSF